MFCPHCGKQLEGRPKYCGYCGTKLPEIPFDMPENPASPDVSADYSGHNADDYNSGYAYGGSAGHGGSSTGYSDAYGGYGTGNADSSYGSSADSYDSGYTYGGSAGHGGSSTGYSGAYGGYGTGNGYSAGASGSYGTSNGYGRSAGGGVTDPPVPGYGSPDTGTGASYFDGTGAELFGKMILLELLTIVTCSLATPWVLVDVLRWRKRHTVINGRRLDFDGTAGELFGHWIKWFLLTIVTCGIYAYFARIDYLKWERGHTFYQGESPYTNAGSRTSYFDGTVAEYVGSAVLSALITVCSCGIAGAWGVNMVTQYEMKGTVIGGDRLVYTGTGGSLFGIYLVNFLLTAVTCGIYWAWGTCALNRYIYGSIHVDSSRPAVW